MVPTATTSTDPIAGDFLCPGCGYNLRGLTQDRCPECGAPFDRAKISESQLPWLQRAYRGRLRSYWRTVWQVTWHPRLLAAEFNRPVDYAHSQRFRWFTIFWAWLPLAISTLESHLSRHEDYLLLRAAGLTSDLWLSVSFHLAAVLALAVLTGVPSYFFHPGRLPMEYQNRGVALSYYACAPLAWAPVAYLAGWVTASIASPSMYGLYAAFALAAMQVALWWRALATLVHRILRQQGSSTILPYFTIPLAAMASATLVALAADLTAFYFGLMYFSLRN